MVLKNTTDWLVMYSSSYSFFYLTSKFTDNICAININIKSKPRPIINDKIYGFFFLDTIRPTNTHIGVKYVDKIKIKEM